MKIARKDMILHTVQNHNILPITSACNTACIFCSHKFNPSNLDIYKLPKLSLNDIEDMVSFLNPRKKIVIGESATRIIEGEPFIRQDILDILKIIRSSFKNETIEITTNGTGLNKEIVEQLKLFEPIQLNISLNSSSEYGRSHLQGDKQPRRVLEGIKLLNKYNMEYNGSIVAMPMVVGYDDIYKTISFLDDNNCKTIRIFIPGFAESSLIKFDFYKLREELNDFINDIKFDISSPILLEPPTITQLEPIVEGIIKDSPAHKYGIKTDDIIYEVNGMKTSTRVDCFDHIFKLKDPDLKIRRGEKEFNITLYKDKNSSPGFVMLYDILTEIKERIIKTIERNRAKTPLVLVSELGEDIMKMLLHEEIKAEKLRIEVVQNYFFGGTIKSAGLLLVDDFVKTIEEVKKDFMMDLIIIPSKPFDFKGRDLKGVSCYDIEEKVNVRTEII